MPAFGDLDIEVVGAAFVRAISLLFALAGDLALVDDDIHQLVVVDVLLGRELVAETHLPVAALGEVLFLESHRVLQDRLLRHGHGRHDHECDEVEDDDQQGFHGGFLFQAPSRPCGSPQPLGIFTRACLRGPCGHDSLRENRRLRPWSSRCRFSRFWIMPASLSSPPRARFRPRASSSI
ncbi:hypothetical protein RHSP_82321 [Rhizobium freirei PRF 81]|uniref:Uncharacterized protein n=1 Tax=Rhizobium freirei PRF 81 TaxID=363754 RepID=N6U207_9HYPH|nr:hypothetical protein RHSP_82321 [Rhizobium freirei PRF 81]